ncbi:DUF6119 family protein [Rathayibacter toxicus]|uniref:Sporadically distributed protein, TIGR04141 family n=1 Tax=Rathayibacter toxicus TaxID=145458 RepID=A0A0C5BFC3_9MICO|nr:DUF6119 family protein [Rathayibacter toxicus]AJM76900.1 hypothetical protein TI83_00745 [Rathayibacter toxicus]ALS57328.1 hypothetical protein APU90_05735 [Rathayibacter toxicus]KKM45703.1 hypothetical protein VT73_05975 [Rathayibacter toxicus]PPG24794.1 hypothetical protein C5D15_00550 [Rathayibacter toxicus]PPG48249.1 hypothetical protein C5D16_00565 [Rathayibacter toxicus]
MTNTGLTATERTTLYRMTPGTTSVSAFVEDRLHGDGYDATSVHMAGRPGLLVSGALSTPAKWGSAVALLTGQKIDLRSSSPGAALAFQDHRDTVWAITWGTGFHFLDAERIEFGFGPGIVARSALPYEIKSLTKTILGHRSRVDRSSMPNGSTARDLGVDGYGEVVSSIEAKARIPGLGVGDGVIQLRAAESLNLPLSKSPDGLLSDVAVLASLSERDVLQGLESLEQLVALKPRDQDIADLDQKLLDEILAACPTRLGISWPHERLNAWGPAVSSKVIGIGDYGRHVFTNVPEIEQVLDWLRKIPRAELLKRLGTIRIELYSSADPEPGSLVASPVPLRRWLAFEVMKDSHRYCLHDGRWYRMDDRYLDRINDRVNEIVRECSPIDLPSWPADLHEKDYNVRAAKELGGVLLDRKLIPTPLHSRGGIEPCDIFVDPGILIHVKRGRSSADLSHLLAQGLVSTDALARDEHARQAWKERVGHDSNGAITDADVTHVVLAIGSPKPVTSDTLFTFTKVNLVKQHDALRALDVKVHLCSISES